jgi:hypothetical protein
VPADPSSEQIIKRGLVCLAREGGVGGAGPPLYQKVDCGAGGADGEHARVAVDERVEAAVVVDLGGPK